MIAKVRIHHLFLLFLALVAGCGSGAAPTPSQTTSASASAVAEPTTTASEPPAPPPQDSALPAALIGSWSASTSQSGVLELVLTVDGGFRQRSGTFDWSGKAAVRGPKITFTGADRKTSTEDWSISQGTLTLAGHTYLKTDAGAGGALALAGTWMGMDNIFETLIFNENGTYQLQRDGESAIIGTFQVQRNNLTLQPAGGAATTVTFTVDDAILTLKSRTGSAQYVRSA